MPYALFEFPIDCSLEGRGRVRGDRRFLRISSIPMGAPKGRRGPAIFFLFIFMASFFYPNFSLNAARVYFREAEEEPRPLALRELSTDLDLRFEYEDNWEGSPGQSLKQKRIRYEERLNPRGRGSVFHPYFLEFRGWASLGLRQESFQGDFTDQQNSYVGDYNVDLNFLKQKPFTFNLFASKTSDYASRRYFEPIKLVQFAIPSKKTKRKLARLKSDHASR